jgi:uncharacterized membrane protein YccF (DUF307 family)
MAIMYVIGGVLMCILIITIPFGVASFRLAGFVIWPFGRALVKKPTSGGGALIGNVIWFVLFGLISAVMHVVFGILLCLTIVGVPLGLGNFKLAGAVLAPLGKEVMSKSDPRAAQAIVAF